MAWRGAVSICRRIQTPIRRTLAKTVASGCWQPVALRPERGAGTFARAFAKIYDQPTDASSWLNRESTPCPAGSARVSSAGLRPRSSPPPRPTPPGLIRDAETEALVRTYAKPIFEAAGLGSQGIRIHIVNDKNFNAFVVDGHNMFMHAGTLMTAKTPNQVIGVIAHESGHITGGHLARFRTQVARAQSAALMLQLLGLAAMVGGAFAGSPGIGQAGMGVAYGGQDAAMRSLLAYRQDEESSADQAAVTFLNATKQSGKGMLESFQVLGSKLIGVQGINPYLQTHPLPQQRIVQLRELVTSSPYYNNVDPPELQFRHDLMKAKLFGFLDEPKTVFFRYPDTDQSLPAMYARAIATYRQSGIKVAAPQIDALIAAKPDWPYFYEIKGQFLFESGKPADAIAPLREAVRLDSR